MKFNIIPHSLIPNTKICVLFVIIALEFFACGKITEGDEGSLSANGNPSSDSNPYDNGNSSSSYDPYDNDPIQNSNPPAGVITDVNSTSIITIGWGVVSNADGYYIYRSESSTGTYIQVGASATTSYEDNELSAGTTYYYRVAAYNIYGTGSQSSLVSATTLPNAPTGVTATVNSASSIIVAWEAAFGATGYYIYRSESADGAYTQVGSSVTNTYTNIGLSAGTTFYYKVAAYNGGGIGVQSSYASTAMQPSVTTGVTATLDSATNSINVNWEIVYGTNGFYIYRSETATGTYIQVGSSVATSYTDNNVSGNTTYYYKVAAYNDGGTGSQSSYVSAKTLLDAPTGLTVWYHNPTDGSPTINISWNFVSGAVGYYVYYCQSTIPICNSTTNSCYGFGDSSYKVVAYNSNGETGLQSDCVDATARQSVLATPTGVTATVNSESGITISWVAVSGAIGYRIYRSENAFDYANYNYIGTEITSSSYTDNSLSSGTTYYYWVAAYNSDGRGEMSNYVYATTQLVTPTGLTTIANSNGSITVNWGTVSNVIGYYVYRSENASGTYYEIGTSETNSYIDNSLSSGTTYYYKVAAYNSIIIGSQSNYVYSRTATTQCDGQSFKTVVIGSQTWMAENLNCNVSGSKCYGDDDGNCAIYGRLYDWATAMNLDISCNGNTCSDQVDSKHQGICPSGWHIPTNAEWATLENYVGGSSTAGKYLKTTSGWYDCGPYDSSNSYLCEDNYGFAALPGGYVSSGGSFYNVGSYGNWWSASENGTVFAYHRIMGNSYESAEYNYNLKGYLYSLRCLED